MSDYYPPPSFYFQVTVGDLDSGSDVAFQEASGLDMQWGTEDIREGGQNQYVHRVPTVPTHSNLLLKRGLVTGVSPLTAWCRGTLTGNLATPIRPQRVVVKLLNANGAPLKTWTLLEAWPVKWSISEFQSQESRLAIESLEFSYSTII
jgi:phage tail-like protein